MAAAKRKCPRCGVSVNVENLQTHLAKVHPRDSVEIPLARDDRRQIAHSKRTPISSAQRRWLVIGAMAVAGTVLAIGLWSLLAGPTGGTIHLDPASYDFGTIQAAAGPVSTTFRLHNRGASNLVLLGLSTSCMCTTTRVSYASQASPVFGYHDNPGGWSMTVPPGAEAYLEVFYDPNVHPELGHFERAVYVLNSDPTQREAIVEIHVTEV